MFIKSVFLVSKLSFALFFCGTLYFPYAASSSSRPSYLYPVDVNTFSSFP